MPDNRADAEGYAEALLNIADQHDVLMATGMQSIEAVARRRENFAKRIKLTLPPWATIQRADNTRSLLDAAATLDIPCPTGYQLDDFASAEALARAARFPVIVKAGVEAGLPPRARYQIVHSRTELVEALRQMQKIVPKPLVQRLVGGDSVGFEALYDHQGRFVTGFCHRRLRQYPLSGGPSTYCESCHLPQVEEYGRRLLDHFRWTGLAMVEFKLDAETGSPVLMEVNPRPWGSMALPIRAGVEFPWLAFQLARDGKLPCQPDYPDGVRLRFLVNDVQAAFAEAMQSRSPRIWLRNLASFFDPRIKEGVLSWRDPRPSVAYALKALRRAFAGDPGPIA